MRKAPSKYRRYSTALVARKAYSLARWNNKLAWGKFQCGLQHMRNGPYPLNAFSPICFNMTTPSSGEPVWQNSPSGPSGYEPTQITTFVHPALVDLTGPGPGGSGAEQFNSWSDCNDDVLSGQYKLLKQKLVFDFTINAANGCRIRIDFVQPKYKRLLRVYNATTPANGENHMLPDSLGSFCNILTADNMINPMYWRCVRKPVFMTIAPGQDLTTTRVQKTVHFTHNKVINPISSNTIPSANISLLNQLWCVISTDFRGGATSGSPNVQVMRYVTWRDNQGHAA